MRRTLLFLLATLAGGGLLAGCGQATSLSRTGRGPILAVGAESQYANVIAQVGGRYVTVTAVESNPSSDPHSFEASPTVADAISSARIVVQNGLGYDTFMNRIEAASPSRARRVVDVQRLLGLPDSTFNPHLWYAPRTMPAVAARLVADLSAIDPAHAGYFAANARRFDASLGPWRRALRDFAARHPHAPVSSTEPVGDYMLEAAGTVNLTPPDLEADVMNGVDPAPELITQETNLLSRHRVRALVYNQQVADTLTQSLEQTATSHHVPVVGVYETMPTGYDYQSWMLAETRALERAVAGGISTRRLT